MAPNCQLLRQKQQKSRVMQLRQQRAIQKCKIQRAPLRPISLKARKLVQFLNHNKLPFDWAQCQKESVHGNQNQCQTGYK